MMISISIVVRNRLHARINSISMLLFAVAIITLLINKDHKLIPYLFIGGVTAFIIARFINAYELKGRIILTEDAVIVDQEGTKEHFPLNQLQNIHVINNGFEGDFAGLKRPPKDGWDNYLKFKYNNVLHSYEIFLIREQIAPLNTIFEKWRAHNYDFIIDGYLARSIKKLS